MLGLSSLLAVCAGRCWAGASLYVDDAGIAPRGGCQLESWARSFSDGTLELTSVPACSTGDVEWSLGLTRLSGPTRLDLTPGVKWQLRDNDHGGFGLALAATALVHDGRTQTAGWYVAPTWVFGARQQWAVDANLGWNHRRDATAQWLTGAGLQYAATDHCALLGEYLVKQSQGHLAQGGLRFTLGQSSTLDLLAGRSRNRTTDHWATVGLNLTF